MRFWLLAAVIGAGLFLAGGADRGAAIRGSMRFWAVTVI